ncbi:MAG: hypothetical protein ACQKBY_08000 [Verrucomicrobiales bacterium]
MPTNETISLSIDGLTEKASKAILAICNRLGCTPDEALKIIADKLTNQKGATV